MKPRYAARRTSRALVLSCCSLPVFTSLFLLRQQSGRVGCLAGQTKERFARGGRAGSNRKRASSQSEGGGGETVRSLCRPPLMLARLDLASPAVMPGASGPAAAALSVIGTQRGPCGCVICIRPSRADAQEAPRVTLTSDSRSHRPRLVFSLLMTLHHLAAWSSCCCLELCLPRASHSSLPVMLFSTVVIRSTVPALHW